MFMLFGNTNTLECGLSLTEIAGSNPTGGMDGYLLRVLCDVR